MPAITVPLAVALVLAACGGSGSERRPVEVQEARLKDATTLELGVQSCHGRPEVTAFAEDAQGVRVEITATVFSPGDACLDLVEVVLDAPFGERELVDLSSGRTVPVAP
jgi:hypothetical protein